MTSTSPLLASAVVAAFVSAISTVIASRVSAQASRRAAQESASAISRQIDFESRAKIAEFRQAWINELRKQMARCQSLGVTPGLQQGANAEFYESGTMIELLMDRNDERFAELQSCLYAFLTATTVEEKYACNAPFVRVCQDILKTEWDRLKSDLRDQGVSR